MKLSHTTKVTVRKALKALQRIDAEANADDPMTDAMGASEFVSQSCNDAINRTVRKTGFSTRHQLEQFAIKHRLLHESEVNGELG